MLFTSLSATVSSPLDLNRLLKVIDAGITRARDDRPFAKTAEAHILEVMMDEAKYRELEIVIPPTLGLNEGFQIVPPLKVASELTRNLPHGLAGAVVEGENLMRNPSAREKVLLADAFSMAKDLGLPPCGMSINFNPDKSTYEGKGINLPPLTGLVEARHPVIPGFSPPAVTEAALRARVAEIADSGLAQIARGGFINQEFRIAGLVPDDRVLFRDAENPPVRTMAFGFRK